MTTLTERLIKTDDELDKAWSSSSTKREIAMAARKLRRACNMSQTELASRSGLSQSHISKIESASGPMPEVTTLVRYAEGCGGHLELRLTADGSDAETQKMVFEVKL